jgi:hypothetical protein
MKTRFKLKKQNKYDAVGIKTFKLYDKDKIGETVSLWNGAAELC